MFECHVYPLNINRLFDSELPLPLKGVQVPELRCVHWCAESIATGAVYRDEWHCSLMSPHPTDHLLCVCKKDGSRITGFVNNERPSRKPPAGQNCCYKNKGMCRRVYPTFVKALYSVISQGHKQLCGSAEVESQSSAGLSCFLHQMESAHRPITWLRRSGLANKPSLSRPQSYLFLPMSNT